MVPAPFCDSAHRDHVAKLTEPRARHPPAYYASLYRQHDLTGGHVIKLGPKNDEAAKEALQAWEGGLQVGGGINETNAAEWLKAGASKVCPHLWLDTRRGRG